MNSESSYTLEVPISRANIMDLITEQVGDFLRAMKLIKPSEELISIEFSNTLLSGTDELIPIKLNLRKKTEVKLLEFNDG